MIGFNHSLYLIYLSWLAATPEPKRAIVNVIGTPVLLLLLPVKMSDGKMASTQPSVQR